MKIENYFKFFSSNSFISSWQLHGFTFKMNVLTLLVFISTFMILPKTNADSDNLVFIINSDSSIERYAKIQSAFTATVKKPFLNLDLNGKWIDKTIIENAILDKKPDVIFCIGIRAYEIAYNLAEARNKIVFSSIINWKRLPKRQNVFGIANELSSAMELTTFSYFFPDIKRIGILYSKIHNEEWLDTTLKNAKDVNASIISKSILNPAQLESGLREILPAIDALWLVADPIVLSNKQAVNEIFNTCHRSKIPIFAYDKAYVDLEPLLTISPDIPTMGRQAAVMIHDLLILKEIPELAQIVAGSEIILNSKRVKEYNLKLNMNALNSVNRIIE